MTHDELLTKIDDWFEQTSGVGHMIHHNSCVRFDCDCGLIDNRHRQLHKAFRAVVELHKPKEEDGKLWCKHEVCYNHIEFLERNDCDCFYPCPTIQAIEKELG